MCKDESARKHSTLSKRNIKGFSLIELLIVVVIITFLITLVAPASVRLFDKISAKFDVLQFEQFVKKASFEAFVRQQNCKVVLSDLETDDEFNYFQIICAQKQISGALFVLEKKDSYEKMAVKVPLFFNRKGMSVSMAGGG